MKLFFTTVLLAGCSLLHAQNGLYNRGGSIYISTGGDLHANGYFTNTDAGADFRNYGTFTLTGNFTNDQTMS